jgi:hypothetical protein
MSLLNDFLEGIRIGREIAQERSHGVLSMALPPPAQLRLERSIVERLHPDPLSSFGERGVVIGRNLGVVVFAATILIVVLAWLSLRWA